MGGGYERPPLPPNHHPPAPNKAPLERGARETATGCVYVCGGHLGRGSRDDRVAGQANGERVRVHIHCIRFHVGQGMEQVLHSGQGTWSWVTQEAGDRQHQSRQKQTGTHLGLRYTQLPVVGHHVWGYQHRAISTPRIQLPGRKGVGWGTMQRRATGLAHWQGTGGPMWPLTNTTLVMCPE